jgi:hypothetical protein
MSMELKTQHHKDRKKKERRETKKQEEKCQQLEGILEENKSAH